MQIGIVGTGNVGRTLGTRWAAAGHEIVFGSRHPQSEEMKALAAGVGGHVGSVSEAGKCEAILLATPWPATQQVLSGLGDLGGRVLMDATNPLLPDLSGLAVGTNTSGGEQVAGWGVGARVVKAFNSIGFNIMAQPVINGEHALMLYCGDDAVAKQVVQKLAAQIGFDARDAGALKQARLLEPLAMLWISLAFTPGHGREFAFKTIQREPVK